ncbi:MAG: gamma-glutamylcyclotransferase [Acidobacteria bacterium]|nr:gamma-glutamylcyclotransferase [Acidobacteriota bacterium]MBI3658435.1 gamma-glutamylcyclotransferase [Acidobacteriota bacterium]
MPDRIFIYGPFMGGYDLAEELKNYQFIKYVGPGITPGTLYDLGSYPGAVAAAGMSPCVFGEVYEIISDESLPMLDEGQGAVGDDPKLYQFQRDLVRVTLRDGSTTEAWMFFYNMSVAGHSPIPSGNFKQHKLEEKKLSRRGFFSRLFPKIE